MLSFSDHILAILARLAHFLLWRRPCGHRWVLWIRRLFHLEAVLVEITTQSAHYIYGAFALLGRFLRLEQHCLIGLLECDFFFLRPELLVDVWKLFFEVTFRDLILQNPLTECKGCQYILTFVCSVFEGCLERSDLLYLARCQAAECWPKTWSIILILLLFIIRVNSGASSDFPLLSLNFLSLNLRRWTEEHRWTFEEKLLARFNLLTQILVTRIISIEHPIL